MQEQVNQLQLKVDELTRKLEQLERAENVSFKGLLDDRLVEQSIDADITNGTPPISGLTGPYSDNNLLYQVALSGAAQDIKVLNFPTKVMIFKWKTQRLAIPVYDVDNIIF